MEEIEVIIKGARNLQNSSYFANCSYYVSIWTSSNRQMKYYTKKNDCGGIIAVWNERFLLATAIDGNECLFVEVVCDNQILSDNIIGRLKIPCERAYLKCTLDWYKLYDDNGNISGEIQMIFNFTSNEFSLMNDISRKPHDTAMQSFFCSSTELHSMPSPLLIMGHIPVLTKIRLAPPPVTSHLPSLVTEQIPPLPFGWEERLSLNRRTYYYNTVECSSTWMRPSATTNKF